MKYFILNKKIKYFCFKINITKIFLLEYFLNKIILTQKLDLQQWRSQGWTRTGTCPPNFECLQYIIS